MHSQPNTCVRVHLTSYSPSIRVMTAAVFASGQSSSFLIHSFLSTSHPSDSDMPVVSPLERGTDLSHKRRTYKLATPLSSVVVTIQLCRYVFAKLLCASFQFRSYKHSINATLSTLVSPPSFSFASCVPALGNTCPPTDDSRQPTW
jgi:hypothetical protein